MNLLFVCTGNTCRSPMAEGIFRKMAENDDQLKTIHVASAGLMTANGVGVSRNAVTVCGENGIDIANHTSQQITEEMLHNTDIFVCMTMNHADVLISAGVPKEQVLALNVSDPYGGDIDTYRKCYADIYGKLVTFVGMIKRHATESL